MDPCFRFGDRSEDSQGQVALGGRDAAGPLDQGVNIRQMAMGVLLGMLHSHVGGAEAPLNHRLRDEFNTAQTERVDRRSQDGRIDAGVDEGRQRHVTADAGRAIEVGDPHRVFLSNEARGGILALLQVGAKVNQASRNSRF